MPEPPQERIADSGGRSLEGVRVVVTRAAEGLAALAEPLAALGAEVVEAPSTRLEPLEAGPVLHALAGLSAYDWLIFTSQNAVQFFQRLLGEAGRDVRALGSVKVAAVGPATAAALERLGVTVAVTPRRYVAEGLLEVLRGRDDVRGSRVLYLAAGGAREVLPEGLRALGASVDVAPLYRSVADVAGAANLRRRLLQGGIDVVTFTAGSGARAFVDAVGADAAARAAIVTIGPATTAAVHALGLDVRAEADPHTLDGLIEAVVAATR